MERLRAFVSLTRPLFLAGGALLYALGAALATGPVDWGRYWLGQAMVTAVQLAAQYANEYFDLEADRLVGERRTWLSGGSGVLAAGRLPSRVAVAAAAATSVLALGLMGWMATVNGWAALVGILALGGSWAYSAPPLRLVSTLFGVSAASVIVAVLTPLTGGLLQGGLPPDAFSTVVLVLVLVHHAMLLAFEKPDCESDARAGKRTLTVRLGTRTAGRLHASLLTGAGVLLAGATLAGVLDGTGAGWGLAVAPAAAFQVNAYRRASDTTLTTAAVGLFSATTVAFLLGATTGT